MSDESDALRTVTVILSRCVVAALRSSSFLSFPSSQFPFSSSMLLAHRCVIALSPSEQGD